MKRFFALLGGLLTLPAFAENALVYRDEVIASRGYDGGVDAENVSATSAGRTSRRGDVVAGRSISRALPTAATAPVSNRNAAAGRVVASSRAGVVAPSAVSSAPRVATRMAGAAPTRATTTDAVRTGVSTRRTAVPDANALNASRVATAVGSRVRARIANVSAKVGGDSVVSVSNSAESTPVVTAETVASLTSTMDSVAEMTSFCKAQYTECMDNFCNVLDDNQGRCSCSKNIKNYEKTEVALKEATEALQDVAQQIQYIGLSKYDIETLFSQTEAELQMQNTTDNSQIKNSLDKIKGLIVDVKPGTASTTDVTDGLSMDLSGLLDFNIGSAGFDLSSLFGTNTANTSSISNQRGEQLYKTAAARCKTAVLKDCQAQGVDISVVSNAYDMEIDKQCVAYERYLTESNDEMKQTVRNAKSVLQRARLMVAQQKNTYDLRGCINALDSCMQDDYVCGSDYENCLDPSGKYIVNGEIVIGSTPGQAVPDTGSVNLGAGSVYSTDGMYSIWNYYKDNKKYNAWGGDTRNRVAEGSLNEYVNSTLLSNYPTNAGATLSQYLQHKIGYIEDGKPKGLCSSVLSKCQDYTFVKGKYVSDNRVIRDYLTRTMTLIKQAQDEKLADHAETCISDVSSCLGENNYESNRNIAINACRSMIKTCMSVNGNAGANPTPDAIISWVNGVMGRPGGETSGGSSGGDSSGDGSNDESGDAGANERPDTATYITLTFSGASVADIKCEAGHVFTLPDAPKQEGYAFGGWLINGQTYAAGDNISCSSDVLGVSSGTTTITAQWLNNGITLTFDTDGGSRVYDGACAYGDTFIIPPAPTRTGYAFKWWELNNKQYSAGDKVTCTSDVLGVSSGTVTITAQWTAMSIELYYNKDGTQDEYAGACTYDGTFTLPTAPTRDGYTFGGWDVNGQTYAAGQQIACTKNILGVDSGMVTITAHWLNNAISLTYNTDGGTSVPSAECTYGETFTLPTAPTRTGYEFLGWLIRDGDYNDYEPGAQISCTKDTLGVDVGDKAVIRADWSLNRIKLTYNTAGGSVVADGACTYGKTFTLPSAPTRTGYAFGGWVVNGKTYTAGAQVSCTTDMLGVDSGTVNVSSQWTVSTKKLEYYKSYNPKVILKTAECRVGETFQLLDSESLDQCGYWLYKWTLWNVDYNEYEPGQSLVCEDKWPDTVTIYPLTKPNQLNYTFRTVDEYGNVSHLAGSCSYDSVITPPSVPMRAGYIFGGWKINGIVYEPDDLRCNFDMLGVCDDDRNVYIHPVWIEDTEVGRLQITYNLTENGDFLWQDACEYGDTYTLPNAPERDGYTFKGWYIGGRVYWQGNTINCTLGDMGQTDGFVRIIGLWNDSVEKKTVTVQYLNPEISGDVTDTDTCEYGAWLTLPTDPGYQGYTFGGWVVNGQTYAAGQQIACNFAGDLVNISPKLTGNKITMILSAGDVPEANIGAYIKECTYGTENSLSLGMLFDPAERMTHTAWRISRPDGTHVYNTNMAAINLDCNYSELGVYSGDVYAEAVWKNTQIVVYYDGGIIKTCNVGDTYTFPDAPTKDGYTFAGWQISSITGLINENIYNPGDVVECSKDAMGLNSLTANLLPVWE